MSLDRYVCCDEQRRAELTGASAPTNVTGIDYIEVDAGLTTADPTFIYIFLVKPLPLAVAALNADNVVLEGGVRYPTPQIDANVEEQPAGPTVEKYRITVPAGELTDFSTYRLSLISGPGSSDPPPFIDPRLASVEFSFKIACQTDFDCAPCDDESVDLPPDPEFDYRVRDYPGFRRQLLDRLTELVPGFREDDPVDFTTTMVEALAYRSDQQSYKLDWVGTEAFLSTARSRTSLARHARLTDYRIGEGASARVFARFELTPNAAVPDGVVLAQSTPVLVRTDGLAPVVENEDYRKALALDPIVFETVAPLRAWAWRNKIDIYTWRDEECRLPKGATAVTLIDGSGGGAPSLAVGDFLLLAETASPETGDPDDARMDRRHIVRITRATPTTDILDKDLPAAQKAKLVTVEWATQDALPFDLVVQTRLVNALGPASTVTCAEAAGNVMLADHGASLPPPAHLQFVASEVAALRPALTPPEPASDEAWRPTLSRADVARIESVDLTAVPQVPAATLAAVDAARCVPRLDLDDDFATWSARRDLLESSRYSRDFVVEWAIDGRPALRFGDGINGLPPSPGAVVAVSGRFGFGPAGSIGTGALAHVVLPPAQEGALISVTNPLPGRGGAAPEPVASIRIAAPQAFRRPERAVTAADYAEAALRMEEVANAVAVPRWTGAWQTILVYVDRRGGIAVDDDFKRAVARHLEHFRLMGFDTTVREAKSAPLEIELLVCAKQGEFRSTIAARVRNALRPAGSETGVRGFFHADNFTFGAPLYLSKLIAAVMGVEGVQSVTAKKFQRLDRLAASELDNGVIKPDEFEVLRLDDDPSFPERGKLVLSMAGGR